jgi:hypothetical protein
MRQPVIAAVFYDGPAKWQVRVKGLAELHFDDDVARAAWDQTSPMGKRTYLTTAAPGLELDWDSGSSYPPGLELRRPTPEESEAGWLKSSSLIRFILPRTVTSAFRSSKKYILFVDWHPDLLP